jgi:glucans biosynthesis protein
MRKVLVRRQQLLGIGLISAVLGGSLIASAQNQPPSQPAQPTEQTQPAASPPSSVQPATTTSPPDGDQSQPAATPQNEPQAQPQPQTQPQPPEQPSSQPPSQPPPQHAAPKSDSAKAEGAKTEGGKTEGAKAEAAKTEGAKSDSAKSEASKTEGARSEGTKSDSAKSETSKAEGAKSDAAKTAADASKAAHAHTTHPGAAGAAASGSPTPAGAGQAGVSAGGAQQTPAGGNTGGAQQTPAEAARAAAARAAAPVRAAPAAFSFASVERLAQDRASKPYRNRSSQLPEGIAKLSFDEYRDIRFQRTSSLWYDKALFEVQFFHRGFNFDRRVNISEVSGGVARPVLYNPAMFDFGPRVPKIAFPPDLGFAGFRIHYPLNTPAYKDELIVFLGASYFRVLGRNQVYGLSARGLAIDTGSASGEEFPYFTDFWLVKPEPTARAMTLFALLDSPGITGAYQFDIRPGTTTQVQVTAELYPRRQIAKLGIAPLTSMFFYGENSNNHHLDDYRPEVHDSDGLMTERGTGEWMWRPLVNPKDLRLNRFMDEHPRSFSLVQRDRDFNHYQDNEARYERRPSYHVEPLGDWGKGGVELVEIPSDEEIHDNIVAYWVPDAPVQPNKPMTFSYLLSAYTGTTQWPPGGKVIATHFSRIVNGTTVVPGVRRVIVDFAGGDLDTLAGAQPVQAQASATGGEIDDITVERLVANGVWRVTMRMKTNDKPVDLRCYLTLYGEALTETWTYLWAPGA